jgi:hypothetical protein
VWWAKGCKDKLIRKKERKKINKQPKREKQSTKGKESFVFECKKITTIYPAQMFVAEKTYQVKEI